MRILCAALRLAGRYVVTLPVPARHRTLVEHARELGFSRADLQRCERGFWTDAGTYVDRRMAAAIAEAAGQRKWVTEAADRLHTEDCW
jgi:hypothetical protein